MIEKQQQWNELVNIFSGAPPQERIRARDILSKVDINNANLYAEELKWDTCFF